MTSNIYRNMPDDNRYTSDCSWIVAALRSKQPRKYLIFVSLSLLSCSTEMSKIAPTAEKIHTAYIIVDQDESQQYWMPEKKFAPIYPDRALRRGAQGCVNIAYVIGSDGRTHNPVVVAAYPEKHNVGFIRASMDALNKFEYVPASSNTGRARIITNNIFTFHMVKPSMSKEEEELLGKKYVDACEKDLAEKYGHSKDK